MDPEHDHHEEDPQDDFGVALWHRWLAGASSSNLQMDYSVLSVLVMTLGLIMIVEVLRHKLDHAAKGKPFFTNVLEGVYTERMYS